MNDLKTALAECVALSRSNTADWGDFYSAAHRIFHDHGDELLALVADAERAESSLSHAMALLKEGDIEADNDAYWQGWRMCAKWAERDDLLADRDSPAYIKDRDAAIAGMAGDEA